MASELGDLPGGQLREDVGRQLARLGLQACDLAVDVQAWVGLHMAQFLDLCLELGDRLFEIQEADGHGCGLILVPGDRGPAGGG